MPTPSRSVVVTGGRAPVALEWVRAFGRGGWRVVVAESEPRPLAAASRFCARSVRLPPPRQQPAAFVRALAGLAREEAADLVVPTCEEVFTVAWGREAIESAGARVVAPPFGRLAELHDKGAFVRRAARHGLAVPATHVAASPEALAAAVRQLEADGQEVVLKPAFSRFGTDVRLRPNAREVQQADVRPGRPWLAQALVAGRALCTFSLAHEGRLTAHVAYRTPFTAGRGAGVAFETVRSDAAHTWVERFVAATGLSGQVAFDFIETAGGEVVAVECNPRATSGLHCFADGSDLVRALTDGSAPTLTSSRSAPVSLRMALLLTGWRPGRTADWLRCLRTARDPVSSLDDPAPVRRQREALARLLARAARLRVSPLAASTYDIEWNGDPLGPPPTS